MSAFFTGYCIGHIAVYVTLAVWTWARRKYRFRQQQRRMGWKP